MKKKFLIWPGIVIGSLALMLIVVYSVLNLIWSAELKNSISALEKSGKSLDIVLLAPKSVPDKDNAAVELNKVFTLMTSSAPGKQFASNKEQGELNEKMKIATSLVTVSEILKWPEAKKRKFMDAINSREINEIVEILEKAAEKPGYNFNLSYQDGYATLLPHLSPLRNSVKLLCGKALFEAEKENRSTAYRLLQTSLRISDYSGTEPILISYLVKLACFTITTDTINFIADKYGIGSSDALAFIDTLEKTDFTLSLRRAMDGERAMSSMLFRKIIDGTTSFEERSLILGNSNLPLPLPLIKKDYSFYLSTMSEIENLFEKPYWEVKDQLRQTEKIPGYYIISRMILPALPNVKLKEARTETLRNICEINLALHVYKNKNGKYPDSLDELKPDILKEIPIDCINGKTLTYKNEGNSFILRSESIEAEKKKKGPRHF